MTPGVPTMYTTTQQQTPQQMQTQMQTQTPQAAIDNLVEAMDRFTASTSSQQQASAGAFRPSGAATLGPRPAAQQQQQFSGTFNGNELPYLLRI